MSECLMITNWFFLAFFWVDGGGTCNWMWGKCFELSNVIMLREFLFCLWVMTVWTIPECLKCKQITIPQCWLLVVVGNHAWMLVTVGGSTHVWQFKCNKATTKRRAISTIIMWCIKDKYSEIIFFSHADFNCFLGVDAG